MRELIYDSLMDPMKAAAGVLRFSYPLSTYIQCLAVLSVAITLLSYIPVAPDLPVVERSGASESQEALIERIQQVREQPVLIALAYFAGMMISGFVTFFAGRAFGGIGSLSGSFLITAWLNMMQVLIAFAQMVLMTISPVLAFFAGAASMIWYFWALTQFVKALHGFDNGPLVFIGIIAVMIGFMVVAIFATAFTMVAFGMVPQEVLSDV